MAKKGIEKNIDTQKGSWWFVVVRGGSWWFVVVRGGSWWSLVVRGGSWWFGLGPGGSWWFVVIRGGSWWFVVVRGGSPWFVVVRGGSWWFVVVCRDTTTKFNPNMGKKIMPRQAWLCLCLLQCPMIPRIHYCHTTVVLHMHSQQRHVHRQIDPIWIWDHRSHLDMGSAGFTSKGV